VLKGLLAFLLESWGFERFGFVRKRSNRDVLNLSETAHETYNLKRVLKKYL
jgi:hypothetical protein